MRKGLSKTTVKLLVTLAAAVLAAIIIIHHNPLADSQEETVKKVIACLIIVGAMAIFYRFYDRLVSLPVSCTHIVRFTACNPVDPLSYPDASSQRIH